VKKGRGIDECIAWQTNQYEGVGEGREQAWTSAER
jgi:hypothetical protein